MSSFYCLDNQWVLRKKAQWEKGTTGKRQKGKKAQVIKRFNSMLKIRGFSSFLVKLLSEEMFMSKEDEYLYFHAKIH